MEYACKKIQIVIDENYRNKTEKLSNTYYNV